MGEDDTVLPIFFDDHIRPLDPNIVDPIDVRDFPARLPMAQVYQVHCVPARALHSICELTYFWDEVQRCEQAKVAQLLRRRKVRSLRCCMMLLPSDGSSGCSTARAPGYHRCRG